MIDTQTNGYDAIRTGVALLDWPETILIEVAGSERNAAVGAHITRDVDFLLEGQSMQALALDEEGRVLADVIVHGRDDSLLVQVWPSRSAGEVRDALLSHAAAADGDLVVTDRSQEITVLGVEGPQSFSLVDRYLDFPVTSLAYRSSAKVAWKDTEITISRNGVTGEFGYLFLVPADHAAALRAELVENGAVPASQEAVDICRMEMRFPNVDAESVEGGSSPFELGLQWMVDLAGGSTGTEAALSTAAEVRRPVCWQLDEDSERVPGAGEPVTAGDVVVGEVAHAVWSPALGRPIGTARLRPDCAASGLQFSVAGKPATSISAPFIIATSFTTEMV